MKVKNVLDGWYHVLFKDEKVEQLAKQRAEICYNCKHKKFTNVTVFMNNDFHSIQDFVCNVCSKTFKCPLVAKIRSVNETCPKEKW